MQNMTNWQLFVAAGLPTLAVLLSIWRADKRADGIEARQDRTDAKIAALENRMDVRFDRIVEDLKQFYMLLGKHDAKIENLEKR